MASVGSEENPEGYLGWLQGVTAHIPPGLEIHEAPVCSQMRTLAFFFLLSIFAELLSDGRRS